MTAHYAPSHGTNLTRRIAAATRPLIGDAGARMLARTPFAGTMRGMLAGAPQAGPRITTICGGALRGMRMSIDLSREKYYWLGTHEPRVQRALASAVRSGDVVYDIGAHAGFFSLLAATRTGDTGRVIAFEPVESNIHRLRQGIAANHLATVESHALAVSDHDGDERFAMHDSSLEGLLLGDAAIPVTHETAVTVRTATIDTLVAGGMRPPNLLKIDVEGAEGRVIAGARETIAVHRPALLIEIHSAEAGAAVVAALSAGYLFEDIHSHCSVTRVLAPGHYLARAC